MGNNTYKSARILSEEYNLYYSVWCDGGHELYDLSVSITPFIIFIGDNLTAPDGPLPDEQHLRPTGQRQALEQTSFQRDRSY